MKKVNMLKKILSFSLALALFLTSPASVFAVDAEVPTVEAAAENNEGGAQETPVVTSEGENLKSDTLPAGEEQASESQSGSEDISGEDELNNGRAGSTDLGLEKAEGEAEEAEDADELTEAEAEEADACEHADFRYESNGDGTHKKICKDCDEVVAEAEPCEFDENGKCVLCGYEDPEHKFTLTDANGIVKVTGTKKVLNGATKVVATEITAEDDANDFKKMSDALDEEALKESKSVVDFVAYDITLYDNNDKEVKIQGDVNVVFTQLEVEGLVEDSYETEVYHYENESVDSMKQVETVSADTVQMVTNHFSTYIIAVSSHEDDRCYSSEYVNV
ncbi:MAG: hypothetical protein IKP29_02940, partial [Pseudobutyrivibrio sp.]|nr:hypothetical protein [Pseudobutyrivibrio sp.]